MSHLDLCALGHVATTAHLYATGHARSSIARALESGAILRIRRGVFGCRHLDVAFVRAFRLGGAPTCVTALRASGVWAGHDRRLHVAVPPGRSGMEAPTRDAAVHLHWHRPRFAVAHAATPEPPWRVSRMEAMWTAMRCLGEEDAVAALESAEHLGWLPHDHVVRIIAGAPRRLDAGLRLFEPTSESGNETIVRMRLTRAGLRVVSQGRVPGLGRNDLVVEDCVDVDVDGREWHGDDRFATDRDRDIHVEGLGRRVIRLRAAHIHSTWPHTLAVIERVVADAARERDRRNGRVVIRAGDPV